MLHKENRLRLESDFKRVFEQGKGAAGAFFFIKWLNKAENKQPRLGFVVGKKVSKTAVGRHKLKRQMREAVRFIIKNGLIKPNFDIVFVAKPVAAMQKYFELRADLEKLLKKIA